MKKQIFIKTFLIAFVLAIAGCSGDDTNENTNVNTETPILIKTITEKVYYGSDHEQTTAYNFNYENNKLQSLVIGDYETKYIYNGDKIVKAVYFENGIQNGSTTIVYDGDFVKYTLSDDEYHEKTEYTYLNGQVASVKSGYMSNGEYVLLAKEDYTFSNGNLIEELFYSNTFGSPYFSKSIYTYDTKNNPGKFMNPYLRLFFQSESFSAFSENNILSRTYGPPDGATPSRQECEIVYNDRDFPVKIVKKQDGSVIADATIEYQ